MGQEFQKVPRCWKNQRFRMVSVTVQGFLAHKETPNPLAPPLGPGHGATEGEGVHFLMSEVPLYSF